MAWRSNYQERRRLWDKETQIPRGLPGWAWQVLVSLFIFSLIAGASKSQTGLALDVFLYAKNAVEKDISYEEVKSWISNLPSALNRIATFDIEDFWAKEATGKAMELAWPVHGKVTSYFGWRPNVDSPGMSLHRGIDIDAPKGTQVVSSMDGIVTDVRDSPSYGLVVEIEHGKGLSTVYAHLGSVIVKKDQKVKRGEVIGTVGETGDALVPHLHFEVRKDGLEIDPMIMLPPQIKGP